MKLKAILLAAIMTTATLAFSNGAEAAGFQMWPCGGDGVEQPEWEHHGDTIWTLEGNCDSAIKLRQQYLDPVDSGPGWASLEIGPALIESVTVGVRGADPSLRGVIQGFAVCGSQDWPEGCGSTVVANPENPDDVTLTTLTTANGGIPVNASRLVIFAQCVITGIEYCDEGNSLEFSGFHVEADDASPPEIEFVQPRVIGDGPWHGSRPPLALSAVDAGSRIDRTVLSVNGMTQTLKHCLSNAAWRCPSVVNESPELWIPMLQQGRNSIVATTYNMAGLSTSRTAIVRIDSRAPRAPEQLTVDANARDWVLGRRHVLRWQNPSDGEAAPTATQSGIARVRFDVDPLGHGEIDPQPVTVDGVAITAVPIEFSGFGEWRVTVELFDAAGNKSPASTLTVKTDSPLVRTPSLPAQTPIDAAAASRGVTLSWYPSVAPLSGICGYRAKIDHSPGADLSTVTGATTLDGASSQWAISREGLLTLSDGPSFLHVQAVACSGARSDTVSEPLMVDRIAPTVTASPRDPWLVEAPYVSIIADDGDEEDGVSGVASVEYAIVGEQPVVVPSSQASVTVPDGRHEIRYHATDSVGNRSAIQVMRIGADAQAPEIQFEPRAEGQPLRISAAVRDAISGLVDARIEYCDASLCDWRRIGSRFRSVGGITDTQRLEAVFPDDGSLPDGRYLLRVVARDEAGNVAAGSARIGDGAAELTLPIRPRAVLTADLKKASAPKGPSSTVFKFGSKTVLGGRLSAAEGTPIAGAVLGVVSERRGAGRRFVDFVTTGADGSYSIPLRADVSRTLSVRYEGDFRRGPTNAQVSQTFRAGVKLRTPQRIVRSGERLFIRGRVALMSAKVPSRGKRIEIEYCRQRRCTNLSLSGRTASNGRFAVRFPTFGVTKKVVFRLRAVVRSEAGWPFADGSSRIVKVTVKP